MPIQKVQSSQIHTIKEGTTTIQAITMMVIMKMEITIGEEECIEVGVEEEEIIRKTMKRKDLSLNKLLFKLLKKKS
jgi:hypothetical protein